MSEEDQRTQPAVNPARGSDDQREEVIQILFFISLDVRWVVLGFSVFKFLKKL